jgi:phage shock protein PspC (stress-responsive transcriptional regulator)/cold shock CspA family protein
MKGHVLDYNVQSGSGLISGEDGKRYPFAAVEWKEATHPAKGQQIDFEISDNQAAGIYLAVGGTSHEVCGEADTESWYRSSDNTRLGGVCAGLAKKWKISPAGCRVAAVCLFLFTGLPLIVYPILWIALPARPTRN